nr:MAG TPA: protein of unknown function (DUF883) [Caudoviricetes sp.]
MTKEDVKKLLDALGVNVAELKDDALQKAQSWLDAQKSGLDTETRRKVRSFWIGCTVVGVALGGAAGWYLRGLAG